MNVLLSVLQQIAYNKKALYLYLFFTIITSLLIASFPLITLFYVRYLFNNSVTLLIIFTSAFLLIFIAKIWIDSHVAKFENKLLIKLSGNIQEKLIRSEIPLSFAKRYTQFITQIKLYTLFVQVVILANLKQLLICTFTILILLFYNINLFWYTLFFVPIYGIYVFVTLKTFKKNSAAIAKLKKHTNTQLAILLAQPDFAISDYLKFKNIHTEKELLNKNSLVFLNQTILNMITIFRILFLGYFGYFIITNQMSLEGLIIGLLLITIILRSITRMLQSIIPYLISIDAVRNISQKIYKEGTMSQ